MSDMISLESPYQFDLTKHGFIEASAGSGKTYTIERLYLRAIIQEGISTDQILAVTFTEKAASELKDRIRTILQKLVNREFEENDKHWNDIVSKIGECEVKGRANHAIFHFDESAIFTIHGFCQSVLNEFGFDMGRQLKYQLIDDSIIIDSLIAQKFRQLTGQINPNSSVASFLNRSGMGLAELLEKIEFWTAGSYGNFNSFKFDSVLRQLVRLDKTTELRLTDFEDHSPMRFIEAMADDIKQELQDFKLQNGCISYNDMIYQVQDSLINQPDLANQISNRFQIAIIDEFQDTDSIQWQIFKSCFLGANLNNKNRLILVGDPKQSIYGFRGADLNSYFSARQEFVKLQKNQKANLYQIKVNHRSTKPFIEAANSIFSSQEYPWNQESLTNNQRFEFQPAQSPKKELSKESSQTESQQTESQQKESLKTVIDESKLLKDRKPFQLFNSSTDAKTKTKFNSEYSKFIVNEIQYLVNQTNQQKNNKKENDQKTNNIKTNSQQDNYLSYSDIGILVPTKNDANYILSKLEMAAIPATFYKQVGVFQSREAYEILYVLEALAEPNYTSNLRKALLTRFFGRNLLNVGSFSIDDPLYQRFQNWVDFASNQKWPQLFRSMLTIDEFINAATNNESNWQRYRTNYEQIFEYLVEKLLSNRSDIVGAIATMKELMRQDSLPEEDTIHRQDTDLPRVKVMTIHASKGLEFSVVFIFGGITAGTQISNFDFYENGKRVFIPNPYYNTDKANFDLVEKAKEKNKETTYKDKHKNHQTSEWARLYYVAITRAKYSCYLPLYDAKTAKGPVGSFIYNILNRFTQENHPQFQIVSEIEIQKKNEKRNVKKIANKKTNNANNNQKAIKFEPPVLPANIWQRKTDLVSFSSLSHSEAENQDFNETSAEDEADLQNQMPKDRANKNQLNENKNIQETVNQLPQDFGGTIFGNAVHEILENLNFQDPYFELTIEQIETTNQLPKSIDTLIDEKLQKYNLMNEVSYRLQVGQMLFHLMNAKILPDLQLKNLLPVDRLHELAFLFYSNRSKPKNEPHFMNGLIDLVFRHQNKIYLLDWKTNYLSAYNQNDLHTAMVHSKYDLQYQVYCHAIKGWLKDHGRSANDFGGVVYLFVRGVRIGSTNGIYFVNEVESYGY
ncbi:MAG: UvrD-helicase domain-containing protein [Leptonema sp. (in: Bacteria)]|nr:UvrD-helicase domain-containing protein [Leptonema sp. (in: bacteria)]